MKKRYIDGGVAGNCPLAQALPRVKDIFGPHSTLESVISIAPPTIQAETKIDEIKSNPGKIKHWINYLLCQLTDGTSIYLEQKHSYSDATFMRAKPVSAEASQFKIDEPDTDAIMNAIENERVEKPEYYNKILDISAFISSRFVKTSDKDFYDLIVLIADDMDSRREFSICIKMLENVIKHMECGHEEFETGEPVGKFNKKPIYSILIDDS